MTLVELQNKCGYNKIEDFELKKLAYKSAALAISLKELNANG